MALRGNVVKIRRGEEGISGHTAGQKPQERGMTQRLSDYPGGELGHHVHLRILSRVKHNSLLAISLFQTTEAPLTRQEDRACFPPKDGKMGPVSSLHQQTDLSPLRKKENSIFVILNSFNHHTRKHKKGRKKNYQSHNSIPKKKKKNFLKKIKKYSGLSAIFFLLYRRPASKKKEY